MTALSLPASLAPAPVIGIGAATLDHLYLVAGFPADEGVTPALGAARMGGGPVATALCVMARLGTDALLLDAQGDDAIGHEIRAELRSHGVSTKHVSIVPGAASAHASILVREHDGARHITYCPACAGEPPAEVVSDDLLRNAALLHLNGRHEETCGRAVEIARRHGVPVSFDGGAGRFRESVRDLVLAAQVRIVARQFAEQFTGESDLPAMAAALLGSGCELLVITEGTRGSHVWPRDADFFHQPAFPAAPLVDTTGCGDVFHGAFLHGWLQGWDLRRVAEFASRLAAQNARGLGGRFALTSQSAAMRT
jgi:sugar/nucleoside kinase (ribokinase family)